MKITDNMSRELKEAIYEELKAEFDPDQPDDQSIVDKAKEIARQRNDQQHNSGIQGKKI